MKKVIKMNKNPIINRLTNPQEGDREINQSYIHGYYWKDWRRALKKYLQDPRDSFNAIKFLELHPANQRLNWGCPEGSFNENLWTAFVKVDPVKKEIHQNKKHNTHTYVWVEWGPYDDREDCGTHDHRVDTGGDTFEDAMINLAHNIWVLYGGKTNISNDMVLDKDIRW